MFVQFRTSREPGAGVRVVGAHLFVGVDRMQSFKRTNRSLKAKQTIARGSQTRRDRNRDAEKCINDTIDGTHGPRKPKLDAAGNVVGSYCRCEACYQTHVGRGNAGKKLAATDARIASELAS